MEICWQRGASTRHPYGRNQARRRRGFTALRCSRRWDKGPHTRWIPERDWQEGKAKNTFRSTAQGVSKVAPFLQAENLNEHISEELRTESAPVAFRLPTGGKAWGYRADLLPKVCAVYLRARDKGQLLDSQKSIVVACDVLVRGLAQVGIIALVDEATGYQRDRAADALAKILEAFIAKELQPWVKTFPPDYYEQLFRLRGLEYPQYTVKRPQYFGLLRMT